MTTSANAQVPVSLYGFLTPKPGHHDTLGRLLRDLVEPSRTHAGSLEYHLHTQDDGRFFLYEVWRSQADLDRHNATPLLRAFLTALPQHLAAPVEGYTGTMLSPYPSPAVPQTPVSR
ncbi:putative quinol monooxygenase [Streptomyces sp. NRRL F-5123]|uniref:putative quinol monooxygenase n=1 Tax=Streptomyces sp. NRRL F-5123 TaxID=1463856 RepID=UPI0004E0C0B6|nr:putative quinol monooxygenase [Streptomyces sp. NRRL F-5123]